MQDVVLIGGHHELFDLQAHLTRNEARKNVTEVAGGHGEGHLAMRRTKRHGGGEVVDHLRQHPGEVDRVHARKMYRIAEIEIVEHVFDRSLTIVEIAIHGECVDIGVIRRGHLAALHFRHAAMRVHDKDVDRIQTPKRLDRRRACIARGRADDGHAVAPAFERDLKQLTNELHGEILERQRRAVEQLQQEVVRGHLFQRRAGGMLEPCIGAGDDALELVFGERAGHIRPHHAIGDFLIRKPCKTRNFLSRERWDLCRDIKSAVTGKPRQHRFFEGEFRRLAAGGDIFHGVSSCQVLARVRKRKAAVMAAQIRASENHVMTYCRWLFGMPSVETGSGVGFSAPARTTTNSGSVFRRSDI